MTGTRLARPRRVRTQDARRKFRSPVRGRGCCGWASRAPFVGLGLCLEAIAPSRAMDNAAIFNFQNMGNSGRKGCWIRSDQNDPKRSGHEFMQNLSEMEAAVCDEAGKRLIENQEA